MANSNVRFFFGSLAKYKALATKDPMALYFVTDEDTGNVYLYKGEQLYASDAVASSIANGWMSKEDKIALDNLVESGGGIVNLQPIDGSISITDNQIGVQLSQTEGNLIKVQDDGLFASVESLPIDSIVGLRERLESIENASIGGIHYKGSVATINDLPADAVQGDLYEVLEDNSEWCFNGEQWFEYGHTVDFSPVAGDGIEVDGRKISVKIADQPNGLVAVDGSLSITLATKDNAGAMSPADKAFIDSIPSTYSSKKFVEATCEQVKYKISDTPYGTIINYGEDEIRVMCPANAEFVKQNVGAGGDANNYYMTFKTYAPNDNVVGYIEHLGGQVDAEILTDLKTDEHGRKYQPTWLSIAKYDEISGSWTYYGANSTEGKYIGWDYQIDWYDANGVMVASDAIRINLSNEGCHNSIKPYYMNVYATVDQLEALEDAYSWGEI